MSERLQRIFISGAANKLEYAETYDWKVLNGDYAAASSKKEHALDCFFGLRVVEPLFRIPDLRSTVATPFHAAANKALGVQEYFETHHSPSLYGAQFRVGDTQLVVKFPFEQYALKKPGSEEDVNTLLQLFKRASDNGATAYYVTVFADGTFGSDDLVFRSTKLTLGTVTPDLSLGLLAHIIRENGHITGGVDVVDLNIHVTKNDDRVKAKFKIFAPVEIRHFGAYSNGTWEHLVFITGLKRIYGADIHMDKKFAVQHQVLSSLVRGFPHHAISIS